jgi:hypothetical protein
MALAGIGGQPEGALGFAFALPLVADESGQLRVAAGVAKLTNVRQERLGGAPVLLGPVGIGLEGLFHHVVVGGKLAVFLAPLIDGRLLFRRLKPFAYGVTRQPCALGDFMQRQLVAVMHPSDSSQNFHSDHLLISCLEIRQA